jgi:CheY-like chemotaxis protein
MFETVLCVDDDPIASKITSMTIRKTFFSKDVTTLVNGKEAVEYLSESLTKHEDCPPLIFLDLDMPVLNGWGVLEYFESNILPHYPEAGVVILSSSVSYEDFEKGKKYASVKEFLSKPLTQEKLENLKYKLAG